MTLNLLTAIKNMFTGTSSRARRENQAEAAYLKSLKTMQSVCSTLPEGKIFVRMNGGELNFCLKWNADKGMNLPPQAFEMNGKGEVTLCEEVSDNEEDAVKGEEKSLEKKGLIQRLTAFLTARYAFRYNLLTEQVEYAGRHDIEDDSHTLLYTPVDSRAMNGLCLDAMDEGIACWDRDVKRYIESDRIAPYHPFRHYFENLPAWDGRDRLKELAGRVSVDELWTASFHRWMLGLTAQWMNLPGRIHAHSVMPLLISSKQGMGKSTFCRQLMPIELIRYYTDSYDLNFPSSCETKLTTFGLINIDEFDKLSAKKTPLLKNLMQMQDPNIRKPYKRSSEPLERIASFIGTSNRRDLLSDHTGSRRFICIEVENYIDTRDIDMNQVYAQLKQELLEGERYWFTKEEEVAIQKHNLRYYKANPVEDIFHATFRMAKAGEEGARLLTAAEIYTEMRRVHGVALRDVSCTAFARILPELGERVHTKYCNGYWVMKV